MQRVIGGAVGHPNAGALIEGNVLREPVNLVLAGQGVFRVGTGESLGGVDAVAGLEFACGVSNGFDGAGGIGTRCVRKLGLDGIGAVAHIGVVRIHAGSVDAHEDLASLRLWRGNFLQLEDFGTAELMNANGLHGCLREEAAKNDRRRFPVA